MKRLGYAPQALGDLAAIGRYIAQDNPSRARSFVAELRERANPAAERPRSFPGRDHIRPGLRAVVHRRYVIYFREIDQEIRVIRIVHSAQNIRLLRFD